VWGPTSRDEAVATVSDAAAGITFSRPRPQPTARANPIPSSASLLAVPRIPVVSAAFAHRRGFRPILRSVRKSKDWTVKRVELELTRDERVVSTTLPTGGGRSIAVLLRTAARLTFAYLVVPSTLYYWWLDLKRSQHILPNLRRSQSFSSQGRSVAIEGLCSGISLVRRAQHWQGEIFGRDRSTRGASGPLRRPLDPPGFPGAGNRRVHRRGPAADHSYHGSAHSMYRAAALMVLAKDRSEH
jgi:hypothetical protein